MLLRYLYRAHRRGHVTARAHPIPEHVEVIPLATLELGDAHAIHARRSVIGPDLLPRLIDKAFGDLKRLPPRVCSAHQLLPNQRVGIWVSWPARPLRSSPITGPSARLPAGPPLTPPVLAQPSPEKPYNSGCDAVITTFDASAVVQPCSSSRRTPDPLTASRFRNRFPPRFLTDMTSRRFGLPACTASPENLPPSLAQHESQNDLLHRFTFLSGHTMVGELSRGRR